MDAYEKLLKLSPKGNQDRDLVRVLLHCCGQEKTYNPYYALVANKLCAARNFKFTFQLAFWDLFKQLAVRACGERPEARSLAERACACGRRMVRQTSWRRARL